MKKARIYAVENERNSRERRNENERERRERGIKK
jgi:hypothetical protein